MDLCLLMNMLNKNLLQDSNAYYDSNDYYEIFSIAEDGENKVGSYLEEICNKEIYLGKDICYIKEYNESSKIRERELLLEEILIKIKKLDYDKLKKLNNEIERK